MSVLGIAVALRAELASLTDRSIEPGVVTPLAESVLLVLSGMGAGRARSSGQLLMEQGATALLGWGSAAALHPALRPGTVMLPDAVIGVDGSTIRIDADWHERVRGRIEREMPLRVSPIAETQGVLTGASDKLSLARKRGAVAADMESAALGGFARDRNVPFLVIRAVADDSETGLPGWLLATLDEQGRPRPAGLCAGLLSHPLDILHLARLAHGFGAAARSLRRVHACAGPQFLFQG